MKVRSLITIGITTTIMLTACNPAAPSNSSSTAGTTAQATPTVVTVPQSGPATPTTAPPPPPTATTAPVPSATTAPTPQATATTASEPAGGPALGEGDVQRMAEAWAAATSFRMTISGESDGAKFEGVVEVVRPDRERVQIKGLVGDQVFEFIRIGQDTYINMGGQWTKTSEEVSDMSMVPQPEDLVSDFNESAQNGDSMTKGATSVVDGTPCQEWIIDSAVEDSSGTLCIGLADNLPRQFKTRDGAATVTFTDWNAPITIDAPQ